MARGWASWLFAILVAASFVPSLAAAQGDSDAAGAEHQEEARQRFRLGQLYYSQARFAEAAAEFEAAYEALPHPTLLHNIYLARRDMGDIAGATDALTRYLADAADLTPSDRRLLEARLAGMRQQLAQMHESDTHESDAHESDAHESDAHESDAHESDTTEQDTPADELDAPEVTLTPDPGHESETPGGGIGLVPGAIMLGVGGAAIIGGAIAGGLADGVRGERDSMCTLPGGLCPSSLDQAGYASRFATDRDAAWGLFIAGGAVAIVGAVLLAVGATESPGAPSVSAACDGSGCFGSVAGTF